jgi:hypothetical protein
MFLYVNTFVVGLKVTLRFFIVRSFSLIHSLSLFSALAWFSDSLIDPLWKSLICTGSISKLLQRWYHSLSHGIWCYVKNTEQNYEKHAYSLLGISEQLDIQTYTESPNIYLWADPRIIIFLFRDYVIIISCHALAVHFVSGQSDTNCQFVS